MPGATITRDGAPVAEVVWAGGRYTGKGRIRALPGHADDARLAREAVARRADLRLVRFAAPRGDTTGWRGFDGWINGLALALPSVGLDLGAVDWPPAPA